MSDLTDALTSMINAIEVIARPTPTRTCIWSDSRVAVARAVSKAQMHVEALKSTETTESTATSQVWHWRFDPEKGSQALSSSWELHRPNSPEANEYGIGYIRFSKLGWTVVFQAAESHFRSSKTPEKCIDEFESRLASLFAEDETSAPDATERARLLAEVSGRIAQWRETAKAEESDDD